MDIAAWSGIKSIERNIAVRAPQFRNLALNVNWNIGALIIVGSYATVSLVGLVALKFVLGFLLLVVLVVSKWRRRHLAMDETSHLAFESESELQMPPKPFTAFTAPLRPSFGIQF